jgi:hypothetical protein
LTDRTNPLTDVSEVSSALTELSDPLTDVPEVSNPLKEEDPSAKKTSQKRSRRGKRHLKTTQAENEDTDAGEKVG